MSIRDIMSGNLSAYTPARIQVTNDAAGMALREITRAEIKSLDSATQAAPEAAQAAPEAAQAAPVALEQTTGGIVNTMDTKGMAGRLTDMVNHTATMMNNMAGSSAAAMKALSTNGPDISTMMRKHFGGLENTPQAMADAGSVQADLAVASQKFQTSGQLSMNSALANAKVVSALFKNSG